MIQKIISPKLHGLLDFFVVLAFLVAPKVFGLEGGAAYLAYLLAAVHLGLTLLTDFPAGAFKLIPLRVHGWVGLCVAPLLKISYSVTLCS